MLRLVETGSGYYVRSGRKFTADYKEFGLSGLPESAKQNAERALGPIVWDEDGNGLLEATLRLWYPTLSPSEALAREVEAAAAYSRRMEMFHTAVFGT